MAKRGKKHVNRGRRSVSGRPVRNLAPNPLTGQKRKYFIAFERFIGYNPVRIRTKVSIP